MIKIILNFPKTPKVYPGTVFILIAAFLAGCSSLNIESMGNRHSNTRELKLIKSGDEAFAKADYDTAFDIYDDLYKNSKNSETRGLALFGLACTSLTTAKTDLEQKKAIRLWDQWTDLVADQFSGEDPRLLGPYIHKTTPTGRKDIEIQRLVEKNNSMNKEILALKDQITTLKNQIASLEAIDQIIEEKKKEISSP